MIPATAHFIWFGPSFPWLHVAALQSAATHGGFDRVIFHHTDDLVASPYWAELQASPKIVLNRFVPDDIFHRLGPRGVGLKQLFDRLSAPAARANMVRAALLYSEGGVYLDTDTITTRSLTPLRNEHRVFFGEEHVVLPAHIAQSINPLLRINALAKDGLRDVCRRLPKGWRHFRRIASSYALAANNAIFASEPGHPFVGELLDRMVTMPAKRQLVRYALGTHLLQEVANDLRGSDGVYVATPDVFFPLGPEICQHWFKTGTAECLDELVQPTTRVVHWYASVRTKKLVPKINPMFVKEHAADWALCALASEYADATIAFEAS